MEEKLEKRAKEEHVKKLRKDKRKLKQMAKSTANRKKRRASPSVEEVCIYCAVAFIGGKNEPRWVACDNCDAWYHVKCTDLSPSLSREEVKTLQWFCRNCISLE